MLLKASGWIGSIGTRVSSVTLSNSLLLELDNPDRLIEWVKLYSHVGIQDHTRANLLADGGRMVNPLNLAPEGGIQCSELRGEPPPKRGGNVDPGPSPTGYVALTPEDAAAFLDYLGLHG